MRSREGGATAGPLPARGRASRTRLSYVDVSIWVGLFAPKGVPQPIVDKLNAEIRKTLDQPEVRTRFGELGSVTAGMTPAAFLERSGRAVTTFPDPHAEPDADSDPDNDGNGGGWVVELARLVETGRIAKLEVQRVDGVAVRESPWADRLRSVGFVDGYRGMVARR